MKKIENNFCTPLGTLNFSKKFNLSKDAYNFNSDNLKLSSIGFGMYKGKYSAEGRISYQKIIKNFILNGVNVFDVARKYRNGFSEKDLGLVLNQLFKNKKINRNEMFISSKAGLINFNYYNKKKIPIKEFIKLRGLKSSDIKNNIFCASPKFLKQEIDISLKNLKLKCLDNYYLHNPEFLNTNKDNDYKDYYKIFETFEKAIEDKKIKSYGISSWTGFRRYKDNSFYIDIEKIIKIAFEVGGKKNGFKNLQIPLSLYMPFARTNYSINTKKNLFEFCKNKKINIFSSASLYEGKIKEFFNLLNIFIFLKKNKSRTSINNNLNINRITLPESDNSLLQLFEVIEKISKNPKNFYLKFDKNIYMKSLNFIRSDKFITSSLFGVENLSQSSQNLDILKKRKLSNISQKKIWEVLS